MEWSLESPDGAIRLAVTLGPDGALSYRVTRHGQEVVAPSRLGIVRADADLGSGLSAVAGGAEPGELVESYDLRHGRRRHRTVRARTRTLAFRGRDGAALELDLRLQDDGVAFRYRFPAPPAPHGRAASATVLRELTSVRPAGPGQAWLQPTQQPGPVAPAHENPYLDGVAVDAVSPTGAWDLPATFATPGGWLLVTESGLDDSYYGSNLGAAGKEGYPFAGPAPGDGAGVGPVEPVSTLPWTLPWRVLVVASDAGGLPESGLVDDVARPSRLADDSWVRPGRASWSWWAESDSPRHPDRLRDYVDLAHEMGWEYSLVDAGWDALSEGEIIALIGYAAQRDVRILLWYNSGGPHNTVPETPRDRMDDPGVRRAELARIASWGVAGIKVDFFQSDKQDGIARYLSVLADAAEHHLMAVLHGCSIPRGWTRTWPNLMTMEGVRGAETYKADDPGFPAQAPVQNTVLPFTRNAVGPMDYTPVTFSDNVQPHVTTMAHELALAVVFESGLLHLADSAASYRAAPPAVRALLTDVPVAWDELVVLAADPGRLVVLARRCGTAWWVAGLNGRPDPVQVTVDLARLTPSGTWWTGVADGSTRDSVRDLDLTTGEPVSLAVAGSGGFLLRTTQVANELIR